MRTLIGRRLQAALLVPILLASAMPARAQVPKERPTRAGDVDKPRALFRERWVYCSANLLVDENVDRVTELIRRSARSGYTAMMLADYKFQILDRMDQRYFRNVERVRTEAARDRLEIIPAVFSVGYSNGILAHDPNLAEGLPASDVTHVVKDGLAVLESLPGAEIRNGDFEQADRDRFAGFSFQDDPGIATFADDSVAHAGRRSCRIEPGKIRDDANARVIQHLKVRRQACYRLSCWVKTRELSAPGGFHLLALGSGSPARTLTFHEAALEPTAEWTKQDVVFNSLDQDEINVYAGIWGKGSGTVWIDDLRLEELSLVNVLRREGCPLRVTSSDGKTVYDEGRDFEPVADEKLGRVPYDGEYEYDHAGAEIRVKPGGRIRPGERLLVSWYHPILIHGNQVMCCLSEPGVEAILRDQARRVNALFHPKSFFMSHDEIRVANWCRACRGRGQTPGQLLADNLRRCSTILRTINPRARIVVWSDMFDPFHNAVDGYYLVNGSLKGSWDGLGRDVIVANWNGGKARDSLAWFASRGHRQVIAGYYDDDDLAGLRRWVEAARGTAGIVGFMYTTWSSRYELLDRYGVELKKAR